MVITSILKHEGIKSILEPGPDTTILSNLVTSHDRTCPLSRAQILDLENEDLVVHNSVKPRLVVFDMDSTLIDQECIDLLASYAGVESQVSQITTRAMNGELDFEGSLRERVHLLSGLPITALQDVKGRITLASGAVRLCTALHRMGVEMVIASGGFMPLALHVASLLGIPEHRVFANNLGDDGEQLTGTLDGDIVDARMKQTILEKVRDEIGCSNEKTVAIGDGANDLLMLNAAGLGIAIHAKEMVQRAAPARIRFGDLMTVLFLFGHDAESINDLCFVET